LNLGDDGSKHLFKRRLTPLEALELATGTTIVCARLSGEGAEGDYADSLEVLSMAPGLDLLFEFACRSVELVFKRQLEFGYYKPSFESNNAVAARRLWIEGKLTGAVLYLVHTKAAAVQAPSSPPASFYNDGMDFGLTEGQIISEHVRRVSKGDIWQ